MLPPHHFQLACRYDTFVTSLDALSRDNLQFLKEKALKTLFDLLVAKPEQEAKLLAALVNKVCSCLDGTFDWDVEAGRSGAKAICNQSTGAEGVAKSCQVHMFHLEFLLPLLGQVGPKVELVW